MKLVKANKSWLKLIPAGRVEKMLRPLGYLFKGPIVKIRLILSGLAPRALLCAMPVAAHAQILVVNAALNTIGESNATTGAT